MQPHYTTVGSIFFSISRPTPKYYNPYYGDPQQVPLIWGNSHITPYIYTPHESPLYYSSFHVLFHYPCITPILNPKPQALYNPIIATPTLSPKPQALYNPIIATPTLNPKPQALYNPVVVVTQPETLAFFSYRRQQILKAFATRVLPRLRKALQPLTLGFNIDYIDPFRI